MLQFVAKFIVDSSCSFFFFFFKNKQKTGLSIFTAPSDLPLSTFSNFWLNFFLTQKRNIFLTIVPFFLIQTDLCSTKRVLSESVTIWLLGVLKKFMWHFYSGPTTWCYDRDRRRRRQTHTGDERTGSSLAADDTPEWNTELEFFSSRATCTYKGCSSLRSPTSGCWTAPSPVPELAFRQS